MHEPTTSAGRYSSHLSFALELVAVGQGLLRDELQRPGGPRGAGAKAPIDEVIEARLVAALRERFPTYGIVCEESEAHQHPATDAEAHTWLLDPHDGTSWFLDGWRGSSVSLALLRSGEPVLGVVGVFGLGSAGDVFCWAEGEPVRRNGVAVPRGWDDHLGPEHTVIHSQKAELDPARFVRRSWPARVRAMPSLAHRLALVAVGEGDLAVATEGPVGYDYAAGHALLRGAGGDLFDTTGAPVRYDRHGQSAGNCVGGHGPQVRAWLASAGAPEGASLDAPRATRPARGRIAPQPLLDRAHGCLLGQCIGDALGALVEFESAEQIAQQYPEGPYELSDGGTWGTLGGQPTDDTELALSLARGLLDAGGYDDEVIAQRYALWLASNPFDVGGTTARAFGAALGAMRAGRSAAEAARTHALRESAANGSLMRVSPLAVFGHDLPPSGLAELARRDAQLSHPEPRCQGAGVVFTAALVAGLHGGDARAMFDAAHAAAVREEVVAPVRQALEAARHAPPGDFMTLQGYVLIALQNAFYQLLHAPTPDAGLVATVRAGGDTDTNGAIAGALLGACHGSLAWPARWRDRVLTCRPLEGLPRVRRPRPQAFWPTDLLPLAEALLTCRAAAPR